MNTSATVLLVALYAFVPPLLLYRASKRIFLERDKSGIHEQYLIKFLIALLFLPLLYFSALDFGLVPTTWISIALLVTTIVLAAVGYSPARKKGVLFLYIGGVEASFMEEILYRGILFALLSSKFSIVATVAVTSLLFGVWHLKNWHWSGKGHTIYQFFYTFLFYGPVFALARIMTGDLYLAIFLHFLVDAVVAFTPRSLLDKLPIRGKKGMFDDANLPG